MEENKESRYSNIAIPDFPDPSILPDGMDFGTILPGEFTPEPPPPVPEEEKTLDWNVDDFEGITDTVYEAIMVAAKRARQIARRQKQEIDSYNNSMEASEIVNQEDEESIEPGVDHFNHVKPLVVALRELKEGRLNYDYEDNKRK